MTHAQLSDWGTQKADREERLRAGSHFAKGKIVAPGDVTKLLEAIVRPGDRLCLEGDNQKQADFLAVALAQANPKVLHDIHVVQSGIVLAAHLDLFAKGIAKKLDYSYSGPKARQWPAHSTRADRARRDPHLHRAVRTLSST